MFKLIRPKVLFGWEPTGGKMRKLVKGADALIYSDLWIDVLRLRLHSLNRGFGG